MLLKFPPNSHTDTLKFLSRYNNRNVPFHGIWLCNVRSMKIWESVCWVLAPSASCLCVCVVASEFLGFRSARVWVGSDGGGRQGCGDGGSECGGGRPGHQEAGRLEGPRDVPCGHGKAAGDPARHHDHSRRSYRHSLACIRFQFWHWRR